MSSFEATLVRIHEEADTPTGTVSVRGAMRAVFLQLVPDARPGDVLLYDAGVALTVLSSHTATEEKRHVSRNTG